MQVRSSSLKYALSLSLLLGMTSMQPFFLPTACAQETTGAMQGTLKDPSGAIIANAKVTVTTPSLVGEKSTNTDHEGKYHFANLPPGTYTVRVEEQGFTTLKREGVVVEVGHTPTLDLSMAVGAEATVVEVNSSAPVIDVTSDTTQTNITQDVIDDIPHGRSFQSVIEFAPSARNEPLQGNTVPNGTLMGNGTGGTSPGNGGNGNSVGYSVAGAADSENSYLVEGQETADVIGGYSHTNVPFDFIQEMEVKTSGVQAEYRGSLGGTVNVIMKKGSNHFHGSAFMSFEDDALDGSPTAYSRYDPNGTTTTLANGAILDPAYQQYQPKKDKFNDFFPGFTFGGPVLRDRLFFFAAFNPEFHNTERFDNFGGATTPFSQNTQTYYTTARLDAAISQKLHVFGSWLYQGQRQSGESLPYADSTTGLFNPSSASPISNFSHALGYEAPNITTNFGADWTISKAIVSTTRFGYFFANYHDFGYPTSGNTYYFSAAGLGEPSGYATQANTGNFTRRNAEKHTQFDQDISLYKSGWAGTHTFQFGYQLNRQGDDIFQGFNAPFIEVDPGIAYAVGTTTGAANCPAIVAAGGIPDYNPSTGALQGCGGTDGYEYAYDAGNAGVAVSYNHALYAQDSWTLGHGLTINAGLRLEKEYLPAENQPGGEIVKPINFGWGDKLQPRIGAAWDVYGNGKLKVFGEYGAFTDVMKLNLAISSFGGQFWNNCVYALSTTAYQTLSVTPNSQGRYCPSNNGPALLTGAPYPPASAISRTRITVSSRPPAPPAAPQRKAWPLASSPTASMKMPSASTTNSSPRWPLRHDGIGAGWTAPLRTLPSTTPTTVAKPLSLSTRVRV